jgi:hypothetical protein
VNGDLRAFVGEWELSVDLPGAQDVRGHVAFDLLGDVLVQRTTVPVEEAPDSCCVVVRNEEAGFTQHYFDSRGVARLYAMTFDGDTWTLERTKPDFTPLESHQRFMGRFDVEHSTINGEWQSSNDGHDWHRDFGLTYRRLTAKNAAPRP